MQPIIRATVSDVINELEASGKLRKEPPFTYHHPIKSKLAAIVQKMPTGKGHARFQANW